MLTPINIAIPALLYVNFYWSCERERGGGINVDGLEFENSQNCERSLYSTSANIHHCKFNNASII